MSTLSEQQQEIIHLLEARKNIFMTGSAGTGKSFLIRHMFQLYPFPTTQICSMTGVSTVLLNAAIPHGKATTLHSWSGIGLCNMARSRIIDKVLRNKRCVDHWKTVQLLIVDEVSMMSEFVFETVEALARKIRRNDLPFGGIQVVFTGDMFQLPPVGGGSGEDTGAFCFESPLWNSVFRGDNGQCMELTHIFRQKGDDVFIEILNEIRLGQCSEEGVRLLRSRVGVPVPEHMALTKLFPTRFNVDNMNQSQYNKLTGEECVYPQILHRNIKTYLDTGRSFNEIDQLQCIMATPEILEREMQHFKNALACSENLKLKVGSVVMCIANLDVENGIVNGSQGIVVEFHMGVPMVEFTNGLIYKMQNHVWQNSHYPCLAIGQIPLVLSWATTIHKSQGMTLACAEIDLGNQIFEYGQAYVALSRVQNLEGLYLTHFNPYKIKANPRVLKFYHSLGPSLN